MTFTEKWLDQFPSVPDLTGEDEVTRALLMGYMAGWNGALDGGDIFPTKEQLAELAKDYQSMK